MNLMSRYLTLLLMLMCSISPVTAQDEEEAELPISVHLNEEQIRTLSDELTGYVSEVNNLSVYIPSANKRNIGSLERRLQQVQVRWQAYTDVQQLEITSTPVLMELMSQYQVLYASTMQAVAQQKAKLEAREEFQAVLDFIRRQKKPYEGLALRAKELSLVQQTAKQLAQLKAEEQLTFQDVTARYEKGKAAMDADPGLKARQKELEDAYVEIMLMSQDIQAAVYKTLIQRVKEYVLSLAGVAILLMFLAMVKSRISAIKAARDAARKYADNINKTDYPTI